MSIVTPRRFPLWNVLFSLCLFTLVPGTLRGAGTPVVWGRSIAGLATIPPGVTNRVNAIAAGLDHTLALKDDGTVVAWGENGAGQCNVPPNLTGVRAIAAGGYHSLALKSNGVVVAWGLNDAGQTNVPSFGTGVKQIAAGDFHSMALLSNGVLRGWGSPLGRDTQLSGVTSCAAGAYHNVAIQNGSVLAWGSNSKGQTDVPYIHPSTPAVSVAAGAEYSWAILQNGTLIPWGNVPTASSFGGTNIVAGPAHILAIQSDGTVSAWGANSVGQTEVPSGLRNVIAVAAGSGHSVALRLARPRILQQPADRTVEPGSSASFAVVVDGSPPFYYQWRKNGAAIAKATNATYNLQNVQTNHAGNYTVVVSNAVGSVTSTVAQLTVNVSPFITQHPQSQDVALGAPFDLSVLASGSGTLYYRWKRNGTNITNWRTNNLYRVTAAYMTNAGTYSVMVSNTFGIVTSQPATVSVNPPPLFTQQPQSQTIMAGMPATFVVGVSNYTGVQWLKNGAEIPGATDTAYHINSAQTNDAGSYSVRATNPFGSTLSTIATLTVQIPAAPTTNIVLWGQSVLLVDTEYINVTPPSGFDDTVRLSAGLLHHVALMRDGTVNGWGANNFGQARPPAPLSNITAVAAGGYHSLALRENGRVVAWGRNDYGQTNVPPDLTNVIAITAGGSHSLALQASGRVVAWGYSNHGQANVPTWVTNATGIAAGLEHSLALLANGTVTNWGNNSFNQGRIPRGLTDVVALAAGDYHSLALRANGTVVAWGWNEHGQTNVPAGLNGVVAIAAGANHSLALKSDGTVVCWGSDSDYQSTTPDGLRGVIAIAAGGARSLAVRRSQLRLLPGQLTSQGFLVRFASSDGGSVGSDRAARCEIYASTNLALPLSNWIRLNGAPSANNDAWSITDTNVGWPQRFYYLRETP